MAKNIKSLQLLRNGQLFNSYAAAVAGITDTSTDDGVIKLARYTDESNDPYSGGTSGNVKTIFGIYHTAIDSKPAGYTIYESYKEVIEAIKKKIDDMSGDGEGSIAEQIKAAIDRLNSRKDAGESEVFSSVYQDSGVTSASTRNLSTVKLAGYTAPQGTNDDNTTEANKVAAADSLGDALAKLQKQINSMDKVATSGEGEVVVTVVEADGKVTEQKEKISKVLLNDYAKDTTGATKADKVAATDNLGTALSKLENQIEVVSANTKSQLDNLDYNLAKDDNKVVVSLNQTDGEISGESVNISSVKLAGYTVGGDDSAKVAATDTLGEALGKLQGQINGMDKAASVVDGQVVTTVTETDGKVSETKANVKDLQLGGYSKDANATGDIASTDTINTALSKLENKAAAITITNADGTINVTTGVSGTDINVNVKSGEKVIKKDGDGGLYTNLNLVKITSGLGATVKESYEFRDSDGNKIGESIDIAKDSHIVSISYISDSGDTKYQNLEYKYLDVNGTEQTEYVDISSLVLEAEFASGITVTNHVAHGVVDPSSEKNSGDTASFLTVGTNGFKVDGIKQEIINRINELDVTDAAVAGEYVSAVNETDGKVAISRANVSDAVLNGYTKGTAPASTAIAATDDVKGALAKLEHQVDAAKAAATTKVVEGTDAGNNMTIASATSETDGSVTYTVNLTDVASKAALDAEVTRAKNAEKEIADKVGLTGEESGRTWSVASANYATGNTVNDSIKNLDTQVKANADAIAANKVISANSALTVTSAATGTTLTVVVDSNAHTVDSSTLAVTDTKNTNVVSPIAITSSGIAFADVLDAGFYD